MLEDSQFRVRGWHACFRLGVPDQLLQSCVRGQGIDQQAGMTSGWCIVAICLTLRLL